jgi:hypothetical protein
MDSIKASRKACGSPLIEEGILTSVDLSLIADIINITIVYPIPAAIPNVTLCANP